MPARTPYPRTKPAAALAIAIRTNSFHIARGPVDLSNGHCQIQYFCGTKLTRRKFHYLRSAQDEPSATPLDRRHACEHNRKCEGQQTCGNPAQQDDPRHSQHSTQTKDGVRPKLFERRNDIGVTIGQNAKIHFILCKRNAGGWSGVAGVALRRPRERSNAFFKRSTPASAFSLRRHRICVKPLSNLTK